MVIAKKFRVEKTLLQRGRDVVHRWAAVVKLAPTLVPCVRVPNEWSFVAMMRKTRTTRKIELLYKNVGSKD